MKKMMMMAMMLVAGATAFAGDSDGLKAIMKAKTYAEAEQLVKQNLGSLADNAEKAKAYNKLVDLCMDKVAREVGTMNENQMAVQMGSGKTTPYDTLGLADAICNAIDNAIECDKYDQLPNAKGKVKPQFNEKNTQRVWPVRVHLVNIGQEEARKGNNAGVLKYWGMFTDSAEEPFFASQDHKPEQEYAGQVAFFAGRYAFDAKDMKRANKYFEVAKRDPKQRADAVNAQLYAMRSQLKTREDSLSFVNMLKGMYDQDPQNDAVTDALILMYDGLDKKAEADFLAKHLQKFPNNFSALANMGMIAYGENRYEEAIDWLNKAAAVKPDNAAIFTFLGTCYSGQADNTENKAKNKELYQKAIEAFDKAKQLDPQNETRWGYNRYRTYYTLYGGDDPRTKAAEADNK